MQKEIVKIDRKWTKGVNFYSMKVYVLSWQKIKMLRGSYCNKLITNNYTENGH